MILSFFVWLCSSPIYRRFFSIDECEIFGDLMIEEMQFVNQSSLFLQAADELFHFPLEFFGYRPEFLHQIVDPVSL